MQFSCCNYVHSLSLPVAFTSSDPKTDRRSLEDTIIEKFSDVIVEARSSRGPGLSLLLV